MAGTFSAVRTGKRSVFDPRTKILLVIMTIAIMTSGGGTLILCLRWALTAVPFLLLISERKFRTAFIYAGVYTAAYITQILLMPIATGAVNFLLVALAIAARLMPGIAMASYLVSTTTVSEFMASMERMHIPQKITIPMSVMFRFFPTVGEEYSGIADAMRMRGIRFGGGKPDKMLEYRLVPLMISCVKIGDELSAAALTRGLGAPVKRTNICKIGFRIWDIIAILLCIAAFAAMIISKFI